MNTQWKNIIGHSELIKRLQTLQMEDRIPHAMLFCGAEGVGKAMTAEALAAVLLCHEPSGGQCCGRCPACLALQAGSHPDYFRLLPESSGKAARSIRIEAVRELQAGIARVPLLSQRRVVIIHEAEKMNEAAANCLLKTIEEPAGQAVFVLLTSAPAALLDTIISRCMRVEFGILQHGELQEVLCRQGLPEAEAGRLADIADGSAARAMSLREPEVQELHRQAMTLVERSGGLSVEELLQLAKEMSGHSREQLIQWLGFAAMIYRDLLVLYSGSELPLYNRSELQRLTALLDRYPPAGLLELLKLVQEYQKRLRSNVSLQLCLEGFLIRLNDLAAR
ncbi:DNA polymerase III subunit delta' [Anaerovibrio sp.]|uniref:DNA polymerase III subunit delta' n=1 Tax=Anaerovibrio sp. TaxID=1872532 RepID=UPI003F144740